MCFYNAEEEWDFAGCVCPQDRLFLVCFMEINVVEKRQIVEWTEGPRSAEMRFVRTDKTDEEDSSRIRQ